MSPRTKSRRQVPLENAQKITHMLACIGRADRAPKREKGERRRKMRNVVETLEYQQPSSLLNA